MTHCVKCRKEFNKMLEQYCKGCYELQILKGQCLNAAVAALNDKYNPEHEDYPQKVFQLAKRMFEEGKTTKNKEGKVYLEW